MKRGGVTPGLSRGNHGHINTSRVTGSCTVVRWALVLLVLSWLGRSEASTLSGSHSLSSALAFSATVPAWDDGLAYLDAGTTSPIPFSGEVILQPVYVQVGPLNAAKYSEVKRMWEAQLTTANRIFQQIGLTLSAREMYARSHDFSSGECDDATKNEFLKEYKDAVDQAKAELEAQVGDLGAIADVEVAPVFLVPLLPSGENGVTTGQTITQWMASKRPLEFETQQDGCFIAYETAPNADTLAHELGHLLLNDRFFYPSRCSDGTLHHLDDAPYRSEQTTALMASPERAADYPCTIDFPLMRRDIYVDEGLSEAEKENVMLATQTHQVETMYTRSGYVNYRQTYGYGGVSVFMAPFIVDRADSDDEAKVRIGILTGQGYPAPGEIPFGFGDQRDSGTLAEFWAEATAEPDMVPRVGIELSAWARAIPASDGQPSGEREYCFDLYFRDPKDFSPKPFAYDPYATLGPFDVEDEWGSSPYFAVYSVMPWGIIADPKNDIRAFGYKPETEKGEPIALLPSLVDGVLLGTSFVLWMVDLDHMKDLVHLRCTCRMTTSPGVPGMPMLP